MSVWTPMWGNNRYLVNCYTGEIKGVSGQVLRGKIQRSKTGVATCVMYTIMGEGGKQSFKTGHRIVAETKLQRSLDGVKVGHKNGVGTENGFANLAIGRQSKGYRRKPVDEYKNGVLIKTYKTIQEFVKNTGIAWSTLKRHNGKYAIGVYTWEIEGEL